MLLPQHSVYAACIVLFRWYGVRDAVVCTDKTEKTTVMNDGRGDGKNVYAGTHGALCTSSRALAEFSAAAAAAIRSQTISM